MIRYLDKETISLQNLIDTIKNFEENCKINKIQPKDVPVVITTDARYYALPSYALSMGIGESGARISIMYYSSDKCLPIIEDKRPVEGEYWRSRGASDFDVSGFVVSKQAGERLRRMVRLVLEKDETKSWLDYREYEPEWIQFKFSAKEFDVIKLDTLSKENDGVLTLRTLKECKL